MKDACCFEQKSEKGETRSCVNEGALYLYLAIYLAAQALPGAIKTVCSMLCWDGIRAVPE